MTRSTVSFGLIGTLGFYRDLLGLRVIANSTVTESEVAEPLGLDSVQLSIADLDSGDGRIVELIEYLQPKGRRIAYESYDPATAHVAFTVDDLAAVRARLMKAGATIVSRRPITVSDPGGGVYVAIFLSVRDPDGAILELAHGASRSQP